MKLVKRGGWTLSQSNRDGLSIHKYSDRHFVIMLGQKTEMIAGRGQQTLPLTNSNKSWKIPAWREIYFQPAASGL